MNLWLVFRMFGNSIGRIAERGRTITYVTRHGWYPCAFHTTLVEMLRWVWPIAGCLWTCLSTARKAQARPLQDPQTCFNSWIGMGLPSWWMFLDMFFNHQIGPNKTPPRPSNLFQAARKSSGIPPKKSPEQHNMQVWPPWNLKTNATRK